MRDAGHDVILAAATDIRIRDGAVRDAAGAAQAADPVAGPGQPGRGAPLLAAQDLRDRGVVVVGGQAPDQVQGVLAGGDRAAPLFGSGTVTAVVAVPCQAISTWQVRAWRSMVSMISLITARISCLRWLLVVAGASKTARTSAPARLSQASSSPVSWTGWRARAAARAASARRTAGEALFEPGLQGAGDQPVARLDLVVLAQRPVGLEAGPLERGLERGHLLAVTLPGVGHRVRGGLQRRRAAAPGTAGPARRGAGRPRRCSGTAGCHTAGCRARTRYRGASPPCPE